MASDILIVDDEEDIRELVSGILDDEGFETRTAADSVTALAEVARRLPSLVVLDIWLQGSAADGLDVLAELRTHHPDLPVVMISGHGNIETAVAAIKRGAYDYIEKPFQADRLITVVNRATEAARLRRENQELRVRTWQESELVGQSPALATLRAAIDKIAPTGARALISGPSGAGKEVAARLLHARSRRNAGPFVVLNAASMAPERMESELFGVEGMNGDGSSTRKVGTLEQAHGGTLFIDEVADMPLETQAKILQVLQEQRFVRVGGSTPVQVDVRVVSATTRNLAEEIGVGNFREDLYHRLNVVPIRVPALRERREDVPVLARYFLNRIAEASGLSPCTISEDALAVLQAHDWPGNVRELRNLMERLLILAPAGEGNRTIRADALPPEYRADNEAAAAFDGREEMMSLPLRKAREIFERQYLIAQITRFGGNISRTASFIGMERSALHRKLKSLGVHGTDEDPSASTA
jgi:two-component system nitrogen regulation response regulator NtrX